MNRTDRPIVARSAGWILPLAFYILHSTFCIPSASAAILSRSTEISLGREAAQQFERTAVVDNDPILTAKIKRIGARLVSISDAPDYPYEFHLVDSPQVNAFALPGGYIYVFRGLVQLLPNDDALAFVMAHEIGHVARRHSVKQLEKNLVIGTLLNVFFPRSQGAAVLDLVLSMHFSRQDETEADTQGIQMAARAGFDVAQGAEAMRVIRRAAGSGRGIPKLLRSHPLPDDRIARLGKLAEEMKAAHRPTASDSGGGEGDAGPRSAAEILAAVPTATIAGLDGVAVSSCRYFPLKTGARWVYRTQGPAGTGKRTVTVLEMVPGSPAGVYRVETDLGRGVRATQWVTTTADRVLVQGAEAGSWRTEYGFTPTVRFAGAEKIRVPAGEYEAIQVECLSPEGTVAATCWFAPDVGLVKRVSEATGTTQELETLTMPREAPDPPAAPPAASTPAAADAAPAAAVPPDAAP